MTEAKELIKTHNLPKGAKTKIIADWKEIVVSFHKMDGMYWQRFDDKWEMYVFNAYFKKVWDFYDITTQADA